MYRRFYVVFPGDFQNPVTCVLGVLEGWIFFLHCYPLMGGRPHKFQKKIRRKKLEFTLVKRLMLIWVPLFRKNEASKKRELTIPKAIQLIFRKNEASKKRELTIPKAYSPFFFLTKSVRHASHRTAAAAGIFIPPFLRGVFERIPGGRNLCSRGPRGLKFFMHSHPLMGGRPPKFQKKYANFFDIRLINPTHCPAL